MVTRLELDVWDLTDSIDTQKAGQLLHIAFSGDREFDVVVKAAVHFASLGDPEKSDMISELLLVVNYLKSAVPYSLGTKSIPNLLVGVLQDGKNKKAKLTDEEEQHEWRSIVARGLLLDMSELEPVQVLRPLLAGMQDAGVQLVAGTLIEYVLREVPPVYIEKPEAVKELVSTVTAAIDLNLSTPTARKYALKIARWVIEKTNLPRVYWVGPLLAAFQNPTQTSAAALLIADLQNAIANGKMLGTADSDVMDKTRRILKVSRYNLASLDAAEFFIEQMRKEGAWLENRYDGPSWHPRGGTTTSDPRTRRVKMAKNGV